MWHHLYAASAASGHPAQDERGQAIGAVITVGRDDHRRASAGRVIFYRRAFNRLDDALC